MPPLINMYRTNNLNIYISFHTNAIAAPNSNNTVVSKNVKEHYIYP